MDTYDLIIYSVLALIVFGGGASMIVLFSLMKKYKYRVQIREVANGRKIIYEDKAKEWYDDKNIKYLVLRRAPKQRKMMPFPPEEAVEIDNKGHKHVIVYLAESGDYQYATDNVKEHTLKAIPAEQKVMLASQIRRAQERKPTSWKDHIGTITNGMVLVMIIISILVFGGDFFTQVTEPATKLGEKLVQTSDNLATYQQSLERMQNDIQLIKSKTVEQQGGEAPN